MSTQGGHLFGAFGMFWDPEEISWNPGSGPNAWQLLGRQNRNAGSIRLCDFRRARGVYILFDHFGPVYVGLARGLRGIGGRLKDHRSDHLAGTWFRFCWFSFDDVVEGDLEGWKVINQREQPVPSTGETVIREVEALLITVLGARRQNQMKFVGAQRWNQVTESDAATILERDGVDSHGFTFRPTHGY
ncbi:GIY-YIG nuclease family protein [Micromonospora chalcea]|uniref:GIY-YIG nuclease family protein n=1 Tax=Micromonospora chalcea TaxID=1874 RepID=UPI0011B0ED99|nr:GIY-YIG nuclease family protein [Micromonospora chalcea]